MLVVEKDDNFMEDNSENVKMFLRDIVMPRIILGNTVLSECQTYHSYMWVFFHFHSVKYSWLHVECTIYVYVRQDKFGRSSTFVFLLRTNLQHCIFTRMPPESKL